MKLLYHEILKLHCDCSKVLCYYSLWCCDFVVISLLAHAKKMLMTILHESNWYFSLTLLNLDKLVMIVLLNFPKYPTINGHHK